MSLPKITLPLLVSFVLAGCDVFAQAARSPFSSFGLGEQYGNALTYSQGMGGVGMSNPQYMFLNTQNPALLVYNRLTTFGAGLIGEQRTQNSNSVSEKSGSGNLNYLALGIPVKPGRWNNGVTRWTTSLILIPYTRLNYQLKYSRPIQGITTNTVDVTEKGSGGINQFSWSNGVSLRKEISIGMRMSYLFSSVENEYSNTLTKTSQLLIITPNVYERTFVSDFQFSPALSIHLDSLFKKNYRFNFGLVYDFKANLSSKFYQRSERLNAIGIIDSLTLISNQSGTITVPSNVSAGFSFSKGYKWTIALDGAYTNYLQYRDLSGGTPYAQNSWRVAVGFELTPDQASLSSYLKRVTYRTGVSLENYPYLVNGRPVKDFGITFGLSLPVGRVSSLDLALKVGKKGDKTVNTVEENYIKLYFGITFNDQWFIKRRFD